ncbi:hypothetical protein B0H14DRAFT_3498578 [Mycena olivaceomarginata]|nr:hypothetical protein B0H14DRAFT_3498578 [Mycena olivaceomarginata]
MATLCAIVFVVAAMLHVQDPGSLPQNVKISVYYMCAQFFYAVVWTIQISVMFNSSLLRGLMCGADARAASWCEGVASWAVGAGCNSGVFSTVLPPFLLFVFSSFGEEYLHSQGVAHRDIKPENLFFDTMGHLKVGGFEYYLGGGWREWKGEPWGAGAGGSSALRGEGRKRRWSCTLLPPLSRLTPSAAPSSACSLRVPLHLAPAYSCPSSSTPVPSLPPPFPFPFPSLLSTSSPPPIGDYGASTVYHLLWEATIHMSTGPYGSEPYIAPEQFLGKPYDKRLVDIWACGIMCYCLHTATRKTASGLLPTLTVRKCAAPTPDLRQHLLAYREPDCTDPLTCNNTSWHIGSRTVPTPVARAVSPDLVDSDNTSSKIGCSVPTPVACTVSPDLVDSNNTSWKIVGSVPTAVARTVSPDLVDSDNTSWKILRNPVVQPRAENVDSDNKSWEIAANTSWTTRSTKHYVVDS